MLTMEIQNFNSISEKIDFLNSVREKLVIDLYRHCAIAGVDVEDVSYDVMEIDDYIKTIPEDTPQNKYISLVFIQRNVNKLSAVDAKLEELNNA